MNHTQISEEFPVSDRWAFLNHANVAPICKSACSRLSSWANNISLHGDTDIERWCREVEDCRKKAADFIGAAAHELAFLKNTSEGLSTVAEGFPWKEGDNVVVLCDDYPSNIYPWIHAKPHGVEVRYAIRNNFRIQLADIESVVDSNTRLISVSYVHFSTGDRLDLASIGEFCKKRSIDFCVDAIQGLGVFPLDVKSIGIHYLSSNSHKWLLSPQGSSLFFVDESRKDKLRPISVGWKSVENQFDYSDLQFTIRESADRFECGSYIMGSIYALGASLDVLNGVGLKNVERDVKQLTDYLVEQVLSIGGDVASPREGESWSGIVSFSLDKVDASNAVDVCKIERVAIAARDERIRVSPHFYNSNEEIDQLIDVLKHLIGASSP